MDPPAPFHPTATRRVRPQVRVGVGVVIKVGSKIWAGERKGSHGSGKLALPGGHLEMYEEWSECAKREVKEEMDIDIVDVKFGHVTNDPMKDEEKHYVTIFMFALQADDSQTPKNMEPQKCKGWDLYTRDELKEMASAGKIFGPLERLIKEEPPSLIEFWR